ncbi:MAG: 23S rRNA (uridine(2552)-2'-O)-methyltransferase RlmE [Gammaproteobacteria bacterium]
MPRTKSSQAWLQRHFKDPYVKQAQRDGVRSRAVYKLTEIDQRDKLLKPGMVVVDLGAAPGGWSEYAVRRIKPGGRLIALDILPMEPIADVELIHGDFTEQPVLDSLLERLGGARVDLVMSDMAPNISGIVSADQARSIYLAELALEFAAKTLRSGGTLLVKVFQGEGFTSLHQALHKSFTKVATRKPKASRTESREMYLLAKGFKAD